MNYGFLPDAEADFNEAIEYYEECQAGLGNDFALEVHHAISRILEHPAGWTKVSPNCRRCLTNRFPFGVIYVVEQDSILILAIMNLHRHPACWKNRI
ncbi:type II toxin-antitoxin system RelE/ParE family toxin [bacterium]|nr:type II toxin-antitoxin system RelE/ParE family toxin [bacterium]MBU1599393.1 type II toxin-antitoxin system RelE/ParE family toxin [bacterium]MBU2462357.1 type II toxin-antitoxin system RelE/ParE family toxin [bacterium]